MDPFNFPPWYLTGLLEALGSFGCTRNGRGVQPSLDVTLPSQERDLALRLRDAWSGRLVRDGRTVRVTHGAALLRLADHLERFPPQGAGGRELVDAWSALVRLRAANPRRPQRVDLEPLIQRLRAAQPRRRGRHGRPEVDTGTREQ